MALTTDYSTTAEDIQIGWRVRDSANDVYFTVEWLRRSTTHTYTAGVDDQGFPRMAAFISSGKTTTVHEVGEEVLS